MKKRIILLLCAAALLAIGFLWLSHNEERPKTIPLPQAPNTKALPVGNAVQLSISTQQIGTSVVNVSPHAEQTHPNTNTAEEKARTLIEGRNIPIDFWGKVIDQDGAPLSDVRIESQIRHWDFAAKIDPDGRMIRKETISGLDGQFHFSGDSGDSLEFKMNKGGYEAEPTKHIWGPASGSSENPVLFKMWQTNIYGQLITGEKRFHIVPDGRAYVIDLTKGTIAESGEGDLKVWIKYQPVATGGQLYDWSSEIDVIGGGLLEEMDAYSPMYSAPTEGYTPTFQYPQSPRQLKSGQRGRTGQHRFYVTLKNGQEYGRITIDLVAPYNDKIPGLIEIQYAINPSGSRILRP